MESLFGLSLGLGLVVLIIWLIRRDADKTLDAALSKMNERMAQMREEAANRTQEEFDREDEVLDSTRPNAKFDWLFEVKDSD